MDLHEHTERIKRDYPDPLSFLLIELAEMNREYWFDKHRENTQGAEMVRETGLTPNQNEWARQIAEQMGVDHPSYREQEAGQ